MSIRKKHFVILLLSVSLALNSYAAVVSDNDGAAFISKAEFDSMKNDFQSQLNRFNSSIDNKIDNAISSYLKGVKSDKTSLLNTGFVLEGVSKKVVFVGKTNNFNNMNNELYTSDKIFEIFCGTYATSAYYIQDTYDTFAFQASYAKGNASNYLFALDTNNLTLSTKKNVQMNASRIFIAYSTTYANNGMWWVSIAQNLDTPTVLTNTSSAYINSTTAKGYGMRRLYSESPYTVALSHRMYSENGYPNGGIDQGLWRTPLQDKTLTTTTTTCDVSITGTDVGTNLHWPTGSSYNIKTINKDWGSKDLITNYNTSRVDYTYTYKLRNSGGYAASEVPGSFTPSVKGYGLKWNFTNRALNAVYYKNIQSDWNKNISYSGGFPICHAKKKSKVKLSLKCSADSMPMAFTTSQNATFPTGSDSRFRKFKSKRSTETIFVERTAPVNFAANVTYDFEIDVNAGEDLFLVVNMTSLNNTLDITQIGDAYITEEG